VRAWQIKHRGSRVRPPATAPSSSNPLRRGQPVTRTKEEAFAVLEAHIRQLRGGGGGAGAEEAFGRLATTESDCSSAKRGGDVGPFGGDTGTRMHPNFEAETRRLAVGEMSSRPIETPSGWHCVWRIR
jgi:NIMA-interacting peptidyl-prolyl cis-trans isomerase 1